MRVEKAAAFQTFPYNSHTGPPLALHSQYLANFPGKVNTEEGKLETLCHRQVVLYLIFENQHG